jgi:hypothetical protein
VSGGSAREFFCIGAAKKMIFFIGPEQKQKKRRRFVMPLLARDYEGLLFMKCMPHIDAHAYFLG